MRFFISRLPFGGLISDIYYRCGLRITVKSLTCDLALPDTFKHAIGGLGDFRLLDDLARLPSKPPVCAPYPLIRPLDVGSTPNGNDCVSAAPSLGEGRRRSSSLTYCVRLLIRSLRM